MKIVEYQEAKELGLRHYFTGMPCRKGHLTVRFTSSRQCKECQYIRSRAYRRSKRGRLQSKKSHLLKTYGLSLEHVESFKNCQICDILLTDDRSSTGRCVDHDHNTGDIRGILCANCNRALGIFGDSTERLEKAVSYLKNADKWIPTEWIKET